MSDHDQPWHRGLIAVVIAAILILVIAVLFLVLGSIDSSRRRRSRLTYFNRSVTIISRFGTRC
jgi:hypothetical protein